MIRWSHADDLTICEFGSGSAAAAQLTASQASTAAQSEAARNALNFAQQVYEEQRSSRAPYNRAGQAGLQQWVNLLGLQGLAGNLSSGGTGGGGSSTVGGGQRFVQTPSGLQQQPLGTNTYQGWLDQEKNLGRVVLPADEPTTLPPTPVPQQDPENEPISQINPGWRTYDNASGIYLQAPDGSSRFVPPSLAPFFEAQGYTRL